MFNHAVTLCIRRTIPTAGRHRRIEDLNDRQPPGRAGLVSSFYCPNNCVLSLAGDITPERALALVQEISSTHPVGAAVESRDALGPALDGNIATRCAIRCRNALLPFSTMRRRGASRARDMELAASVLSGSRSARLDRALVYDQPLFTAMNVLITRRSWAICSCCCHVRAGVDRRQAEREMDRVVAEFVNRPTECCSCSGRVRV